MAKDKGKKFDIPDPGAQFAKAVDSLTKYQIGQKGYSFYDIKKMKPIFAFDYLSLDSGDICFNNCTLKSEDYIGFLTGLKKISGTTYDELNREKMYRFHKIDFDADNVSIKRNDFKKAISPKPDLMKDEELPSLWQFDLHYVQKARACGFLFKGVFYLVWYDRNHTIYK